MGKIGIFYGSTEGNTEDVVDKVKDALGDADIHNVDSASADDLAEYTEKIQKSMCYWLKNYCFLQYQTASKISCYK